MSRAPLLFIALVSGLLHAYIGFRLLPHLPIGGSALTAGITWLALSTFLAPAPLVIRMRRQSHSDALAWLGYMAMGIFSSLLVLTALRDVLLLVAAAVNGIVPNAIAIAAFAQTSAVMVLALAATATLIGVFNARRLAKVVEVDLPIAGLPDALSGFTIVQISDIHVGSTIKHGYLSAIVRAVNALKPDLVAVTGDIVDGSVARLQRHVAPLSQLSATHGVYCVTGNHEYYSGADAWVIELRRLGLRVLMNENIVLEHAGEQLLIGGVTDFSAHRFGPEHKSDAFAAMAGAPKDVSVKVLLAHQPRSAPAAADAGFDVQLSGHTHGGQFWPWNLFVPMQQPFTSGLNQLKQLLIYTSRGTGYWGPPIRFGAPSEITRLRLVAQ